jgi:hypothetical protein
MKDIDIANDLLSSLTAAREQGNLHNPQQSPILSEVIPRLLTTLLMRRDLVASMRSIFGDAEGGAISE